MSNISINRNLANALPGPAPVCSSWWFGVVIWSLIPVSQGFLLEESCKSSLPVAWVAPKRPGVTSGNIPRTNLSFSRSDQSTP